jgi:hypothetical protein
MNLKVAVLIGMLIFVVPLIFFLGSTNTTPYRSFEHANVSENANDSITYDSYLKIDQKNLSLNHEVMQFKIIFHENDTINVTTMMILQQTGKDFEPQGCLLILSNGNSGIFDEEEVSLLYDVPFGVLFDATFLGHRLAIGGRMFHALLTFTRLRIGTLRQLFKDVEVKKGDVWYLTLAEFNRKPEEELKIVFRSLTESPSMELVQLDRHSDIGFYSALDSDFEGRYIGFKLPFLPFGFSVANHLHTEVVTSRGSVVYFCSVGHSRGRIEVKMPDNKTYVSVQEKIIVFSYAGNLTGVWNFSASGVGFPWKHMVVLFYADVDPHLQLGSKYR